MTEVDVEGWKRWRGLIAFALIGGTLFVASRFESVRPYEAMVVAMAFPLAVLVAGLLPLREAKSALRVIAVCVAVLAIGATELELSEVFFPGEPIATSTVTPSAPDMRMSWPAQGAPLDLMVHGELNNARGSTEGTYSLVLSRGGHETNVAGHLSRTVTQGRRAMRRGAPVSSVVTHLTDLHELTLEGSGPVRVHLDSVEGGLKPSIRLTLREPPRLDRWLVIALGVLVLIGAVVEARAARAGYQTRLTGALGASAVLAWYVVHRFDADDPFVTVAGGVLVALLVGGVGGMLLSKIAAMIVVRDSVPAGTTPPTASAR